MYTLGCVGVTRWFSRRRGLLVAFMAIAVAGTVGCWWLLRQRQMEDAREHPLVVVKTAIALRTGNGKVYPAQQRLPSVSAGMEARVLYARGDWLQVEFPGGEVGWLRREHVLIDERAMAAMQTATLLPTTRSDCLLNTCLRGNTGDAAQGAWSASCWRTTFSSKPRSPDGVRPPG
jgi:hypothetical protein